MKPIPVGLLNDVGGKQKEKENSMVGSFVGFFLGSCFVPVLAHVWAFYCRG